MNKKAATQAKTNTIMFQLSNRSGGAHFFRRKEGFQSNRRGYQQEALLKKLTPT